MIAPHGPRRPDRGTYLDDADLPPDDRRRLAEYLAPRRALDGRIVWPVDELGAEADR